VKVVGVPDQRLNEIGAACVVVNLEKSVTADDLRDFWRGKLASFKIPPSYTLHQGIPQW
jgi:HIP---CoA ligase